MKSRAHYAPAVDSLFGFLGLVLAVIGGFIGLPIWLAAVGGIAISFAAWLIYFFATRGSRQAEPVDPDGEDFGG